MPRRKRRFPCVVDVIENADRLPSPRSKSQFASEGAPFSWEEVGLELNPGGDSKGDPAYADSLGMDGQGTTPVQAAREALFVENMGAFMRRDFETLEAAWRPDVVMDMPGTSWLAGTHRGFKDVSRCIVGLRHVLASEDRRTTFLHEADEMIVRHDIVVRGPEHVVEMTLRVRIRFDAEGKAEAISLEPDDLGLFDHVLNTALRNSQAS